MVLAWGDGFDAEEEYSRRFAWKLNRNVGIMGEGSISSISIIGVVLKREKSYHLTFN